MADVVDPDGTHPVIVVFGGGTPLGKRIAFYLYHFAQEVNRNVVVGISEVDTTDLSEVQKAVWEPLTGSTHSGRPTMIINADVSFDLPRLEGDPKRAFARNTIPASNIALAARTAGIPFVQISTDHVFSGNDGPYTSKDTPKPGNLLGVSLWYAEQAVAGLYPLKWDGDTLLGGTIVRVSSLYGPDFPNTVYINTGTEVVKSLVGLHGGVYSNLKSSPTFIGEAAFLLARNAIMSPQSFASPVIHMAAPTPPISFYELFKPSIPSVQEATYRDRLHSSRIYERIYVGTDLGLVPSRGWSLPKDYSKGLQESFIEEEAGGYVKYW